MTEATIMIMVSTNLQHMLTVQTESMGRSYFVCYLVVVIWMNGGGGTQNYGWEVIMTTKT
jgi:hypothetical protein